MEKIYHYLWQSRMFGRSLTTEGGGRVEVIDPGQHNLDAGPDFFNSKIKVDGTEWAGNVEIHVKASDWYRHGHDTDSSYDNVILHVVGVADRKVFRSDGSEIIQTEISFPEQFYRKLALLSDEMDSIRCSGELADIPSLNKTDWLESLTIERLQNKAVRVLNIYSSTGNDWEQTAFVLFARSLGFGLNGDPFEQTARSLPLKILHHHSDNLLQLEAMVMGQAGVLDPSLHMFNEYFQILCREYYFLARKYGLRPINGSTWKFARIRPQNSPLRRLAMLARACLGGFSHFSRIIRLSDPEDLRQIYSLSPEGYWKHHYNFNGEATADSGSLSRNSLDSLIINAAVPLMYAYGAVTGNPEVGERTMDLLMQLPAENNNITRQWAATGFKIADAAASQALIHLRKEYCTPRKCLYCRFGSGILRSTVAEA